LGNAIDVHESGGEVRRYAADRSWSLDGDRTRPAWQVHLTDPRFPFLF
jgi:hypothetical protein